QAHGRVFLIVRLDADLHRDDAEDFIIHVTARRNQGNFSPAGQQRIETMNELLLQCRVMRDRGKRERAVPCPSLRVVNLVRLMMRAGHKVLGDALPYFLRRETRGPVREVRLWGLCRERAGYERKRENSYEQKREKKRVRAFHRSYCAP